MQPCFLMGYNAARHDWAMWRLQHNPTNKYCAAHFADWANSQHDAIYLAYRNHWGYIQGYYAYVHSLAR